MFIPDSCDFSNKVLHTLTGEWAWPVQVWEYKNHPVKNLLYTFHLSLNFVGSEGFLCVRSLFWMYQKHFRSFTYHVWEFTSSYEYGFLFTYRKLFRFYFSVRITEPSICTNGELREKTGSCKRKLETNTQKTGKTTAHEDNRNRKHIIM